MVGMLRRTPQTGVTAFLCHENISDTSVRQQLERLSHIQGVAVSWLPQNIILSISGSEDQMVTLIHNNGLSNVSHLFFEQQRRLPEEDNLTVVEGFGAYPNALYHVAEQNYQTLSTPLKPRQ